MDADKQANQWSDNFYSSMLTVTFGLNMAVVLLSVYGIYLMTKIQVKIEITINYLLLNHIFPIESSSKSQVNSAHPMCFNRIMVCSGTC